MEAIILSAAIEAALKTLTGLIKDEVKLQNRWLEFGQTCQNVFVTVQEFDKYAPQIKDAILSGFPVAKQKAARAPKADVKGMSADEVKLRNRASSDVSTYFGRVRNEYAFPPAPVAPVVDPLKAEQAELAKKAAQAAVEKAQAVAAENVAKQEQRQLEESVKLTELLLKSAEERKDKTEIRKTRARINDLKRKTEEQKTKVEQTAAEVAKAAELAKQAQAESNAKLALIEEQKARDSLKSKLVDALKAARESKLPNASDLVKALQVAHDLLIAAK